MKTTTGKFKAALIGGIVTILGVTTAALSDNQLTADEIGAIVSTTVVQGIAAYSVWKIRNKTIQGGD